MLKRRREARHCRTTELYLKLARRGHIQVLGAVHSRQVLGIKIMKIGSHT